MTALNVLDEILYGFVETNSMGRITFSKEVTNPLKRFFGKDSRIIEGEVKQFTRYIYDYKKQLKAEPAAIIKANGDADTIYLYEL